MGGPKNEYDHYKLFAEIAATENTWSFAILTKLEAVSSPATVQANRCPGIRRAGLYIISIPAAAKPNRGVCRL
jgi:hypothetical protein